MTVYVDDLHKYSTSGKEWCHMIATDEDELIQFGKWIGLKKGWLHLRTTPPFSHFDLVSKKRELAIEYGAIPVSNKDILAISYLLLVGMPPVVHLSKGNKYALSE